MKEWLGGDASLSEKGKEYGNALNIYFNDFEFVGKDLSKVKLIASTKRASKETAECI